MVPWSTALTLILSLLVTILQSTVQFIPPFRLELLWQLTQLACIIDFTAVNKGPGVPLQADEGGVGSSPPLPLLLQDKNRKPESTEVVTRPMKVDLMDAIV